MQQGLFVRCDLLTRASSAASSAPARGCSIGPAGSAGWSTAPVAPAKAVVTASSSSSGRENETFMLLGTVLTWGGGRVCSSSVEMCAEHRRNTARLSTWSRSVRRAPPAPSTSKGPRVRLPETHLSALRAKNSDRRQHKEATARPRRCRCRTE